jgi:hypothetical protein
MVSQSPNRQLTHSLHLLVDPTCKRPRSAARAERQKAAGVKADLGVLELDNDGEVEVAANMDEMPEYPPRPHGCWDE